MIPTATGVSSRTFNRRPSLLLASSLARIGVASVGVVVIWAGTGWAMGWW